MENEKNYFFRFIVFCLMSSFLVTSCSIDDKYDLSKDVDLTVGVAGGLALPVGSTEKIMLTELIDTAETDVIKIDERGYYSVYKSGTFNPEKVKVNDVEVTVEPLSDPKQYDFELIDLSELEDLPQWMKDKIKESQYPHIVREDINNTVEFKISQSVPEEMKKIRTATFRNPVKMFFELDIYSLTHQSDDILAVTDKLHVCSKEAGGFLIEVPEYLVFAPEANVKNGKLIIDGYVKYDDAINRMVLKKEYEIIGLDFSMLPEGGINVTEDNRIEFTEELYASGYIESDTVFFGFNNISHAQHIDVEPMVNVEPMEIATVEGIFDPEIDPINEVVDLELGDDLDFLNDAYLDFADPRIYVTFNNPVDAQIFADAEFSGLDKAGNIIDGAQVATNLTFASAAITNFYINRYDVQVEGYNTVAIPELNNLIKKIPETIDVNINARMDTENYATVTLGKDLEISGDYQVSVPMVFDEFNLEYTEEIDDVLGDDAEDITDYVTDINSITVKFDVLNTIPAKFEPSIVAYDEQGVRLNNVTAEVTGVVAKGNGMKDGAVSTPVKSSISIKLSVKNGELDELYKLDLKFAGNGSGTFNSNEYLQLKDIVITIDEAISVDLN
ncbi:MAG: hypothetical protein IJY75_02670 [Bacteroidaceae bacterium]|nr:hypothetical protein [Bacteroidaceae bacterium]